MMVGVTGRFTLTRTTDEVLDAFQLIDLPEDWSPRYNIAPTQPVLLIDALDTSVASWARWGLIPAWARDTQVGSRNFNARSESVDEKPSFRGPFAERRCLVVADGFFEWQKTAVGKQPTYFRLRGHDLFAFAGLWDRWRAPDGLEVRSCTILTTTANEDVEGIHDRMPVILREAAQLEWLHTMATPSELWRLMVPLPSGSLVAQGVGTLVNSPANDEPRCIVPAQLPLGFR